MSSLLQQVVAGQAPSLRQFTADEYHQLTEQGILVEGSPIELIDGLIVCKDRRDSGGGMNHGPRHAYTVCRLQQYADSIRKLGFQLQTQLPIAVSPQHEPEPDGAVIRGGLDAFRDRLPTARDVVLVIEVADSSIVYDRTTKQRVYAAAEIAIYWIIDVAGRRIDVYSEPDSVRGVYGKCQSHRPAEVVRMQLNEHNHLEIAVADLLP